MSATTLMARSAPAWFKDRGSFLSLLSLASLAPLGCVFAVAIAVNWPTLNDYFHGDDYLAFIDLATRPALKHMGEVLTFKDSNVYWRPLGEVYYLALWSAFGANEVAFHVANLVVLLMTIALLYAFCLQMGLGRFVAAGASAFFVLFPNHVVSVAWITNGPRLVAVMFALASLVLLQRAVSTRRLSLEVLSFLAFVLAGLADEVALSLAPLAVLYSLAFDRATGSWLRRSVLRAIPYGLLALSLTPLQFIATENDPGFNKLKFGTQMPQHFWALISKLVWPIKDSITFADIAGEQWVAGGAAIAVLGLALLLGSNRLRFLAVWLVLGLAPFTIWVTPIAPARYLYLAAVPLAIIVSWAFFCAIDALRSTVPGTLVARNLPASSVVAAAVVVVLVFLGSAGARVTQERDQAFARDTETYRILAKGLTSTAPKVPPGARIIIYYGIWTGFDVWPDAVAKTIYKDPAVKIINIPRGQVEASAPGRGPKDIVLFYTGKGFIRSAPLGSGATQP